MTHAEALDWLVHQGMRVRVFGESINVAFGEPVDTGFGICVSPASATLHRGDRDASWIIVDHGIVIDTFADLTNAVLALRDYVVARANAS